MRFEDWLDVTSETWLWVSVALFAGAATALVADILRHP